MKTKVFEETVIVSIMTHCVKHIGMAGLICSLKEGYTLKKIYV